MNAESIVAVSAAVVALVQLVKWAGVKDHWGPIIVIVFSGLGVLLWLVGSATWPPVRTDIWPLFTGWVTVTLTSAGTFGFTRAGAGAVTRATAPPADGAGGSATTDPPLDDSEMSAEKIADVLERRRQDRVLARLHEVSDQPTTAGLPHPAALAPSGED